MSCPICGDTGLTPFVKQGKVIPNAFTHCTCHPIYGNNPEPERYQPLTAADFDFPMSDTFRAASFEYCNQADPARQLEIITEVEREVIPQKVIVKHHYITPKTIQKDKYKDITV